MVYLIIGLVGVAAIGFAFQQRRGIGRGRQLGYVPRALRPKVNAYYQQRGQQQPYDAEGNCVITPVCSDVRAGRGRVIAARMRRPWLSPVGGAASPQCTTGP